ncbi:MAG: SDR family NAD(P)-dependent oxidoreductase, partial [Myxococcota bacterium]
MADKLEGKRALVTGASRGIGRGIALSLAEAGADVAIGYRREKEKAESTVGEIEALGRKAVALAADVRDYPAVKAMVEGARDALGGLDVVVANAGVPSRFQPLHEVEVGYWQRVTGIDLDGVFHTLHAALPILREQKSGVILSISSIGADLCAAGGAPYTASKAAVNALTRVVARENAGVGVRANVIAPGLVETDIATGMLEVHGERLRNIVPLGRIGQPRDIGQLAVYLASDAAEWITGKV